MGETVAVPGWLFVPTVVLAGIGVLVVIAEVITAIEGYIDRVRLRALRSQRLQVGQRRGVEQRSARGAHNSEVAGSNPAPAPRRLTTVGGPWGRPRPEDRRVR